MMSIRYSEEQSCPETTKPLMDYQERELLKGMVNGLGKTGVDMFIRRVQALWPEAYPFADQRTLSAAEKLGLPGSAEELRRLIDEKWTELRLDGMDGMDDDEKKRKTFVLVLERVVGTDLEGHCDDAKAEAAK